MPTISTFFGIVIRMYYDDHAPPHFHAIYGDFEAQIGIERAELHRQELRENWQRSLRHTLLTSIEPLEQHMYRVTSVSALPGHTLDIEFADGLRGTICVADRLFGPVFEPLCDHALFQQVSIDSYGVITWPNGADLAPDALYLCLVNKTASSLETLTA